MERTRPQPKLTEAQKRARLSLGLDTAIARMTPRPTVQFNKYAFPQHPARLMKQVKAAGLAMDDNTALTGDFTWAAAVIGQSFREGLQFLGYPFLSELAQRPEYRIPTETIAGEMCRKWIKFKAVGDEEKADQIKELEDRWKDLEVQTHTRKVIEQDGYFGRSHLFLDFGTDDRDELEKPIGDGQNRISRAKIRRGSLKRIKAVEPIWSYPTNYNSNDPLAPDWYLPQHWFVMGKQLHTSRFLTFVGREVPDILKPAYSFGGLALSQILKPYVDNWLTTRQSVNDLIHAFVVWGLKTNLAESLQMQGEMLFKRMELFNRTRDNRGMMVVDKDSEEFFNVVTPLGSLDALQAQAQEHMMSVARIPAVKFTGLQPTGLNASSEGEIRAFYDTIHDRQETFLRKNLTRLMHFTMLDLWGQVDDKITFDFEPLWSMDEKEHAETAEVEARTDQLYVEMGVISTMEVRDRLADDPDSPYHGLDKGTKPDLKEEEEEGLVPKGGGRVTAELADPGAEQGEKGGQEDEPQEDEELDLEPELPDEEVEPQRQDGLTPEHVEKVKRILSGDPVEPVPGRTERTGKLVRLMTGKAPPREPNPTRAARADKLTRILKGSEAAE